MRLIDADVLTESIKECIEAKDANCEWEQVQGLECALECIDEEPTVQPVVRCKDCYHYPNPYADCPMIGWARNEDDYCSKAEREGADK